MQVTADTVNTSELSGAVMRSVRAPNLSRTDLGRDIHVSALDLSSQHGGGAEAWWAPRAGRRGEPT
jgi:hypothetical protein